MGRKPARAADRPPRQRAEARADQFAAGFRLTAEPAATPNAAPGAMIRPAPGRAIKAPGAVAGSAMPFQARRTEGEPRPPKVWMPITGGGSGHPASGATGGIPISRRSMRILRLVKPQPPNAPEPPTQRKMTLTVLPVWLHS